MTDDDSVFYLSEFSNLYCQELINQSKLYLQLNSSLRGLQEIFEHTNSINDLYNYSASSNETTVELLSIAIELNNKKPEENETLRETPIAFLYCCDKFWGKVELRGNTSLTTTLKESPLSKAKLTKGFHKSTLKISFHSDSDDVIANENRFQSSPSDDENSYSNRNSMGESRSNFDSNNYKLEANLGDIKEEDEDYEKDFLMLIGTSNIAFDNKIINSQSINEAITFKSPIMASVPVTSDDENSLLESDDDGVGLGEPRITSKSIAVGYVTLTLNINYGKDFDQIVNTFFIEEKSKLADKIDKITKLINEKKFILEKAICWSRNSVEFCSSHGIAKRYIMKKEKERFESNLPEDDTPKTRRFFLCTSTKDNHNECCVIF